MPAARSCTSVRRRGGHEGQHALRRLRRPAVARSRGRTATNAAPAGDTAEGDSITMMEGIKSATNITTVSCARCSHSLRALGGSAAEAGGRPPAPQYLAQRQVEQNGSYRRELVDALDGRPGHDLAESAEYDASASPVFLVQAPARATGQPTTYSAIRQREPERDRWVFMKSTFIRLPPGFVEER
jgi:hypothetical protein